MSLSFVSSAVQIGTSDGGFEETAIENKETEAVNRQNAHKPLFEQLRSNQEEDQEKKDEMQRQIMRSTCALDDEDVAHLDSLERQRSERERMIHERTQNELESFRAAKVLRQQAAIAGNHTDDNGASDNAVDQLGGASTESGKSRERPAVKGKETLVSTASLPLIKVKKRKRRVDSSETSPDHGNSEKKGNSEREKNEKTKLKNGEQSTSFSNESGTTSRRGIEILPDAAKKSNGGGGLDNLLCGYGSSSDEE
jgi:hypothetical protein